MDRPKSRAAILFAGAAVVVGCGSTVALYGAAVINDAGGDAADASDASDANDVGVVALYGPAPAPDAGQEDADAGDGAPVALYGSVPVDSGNG